MKVSRKILIDRVVGGFICFPINYLAIATSKLMKRDRVEIAIKKVCIGKYLGMGSIINAIPLMESIKAKYPDSKIYFVTSIKNRSFTPLIGLIDESIYVDDRSVISTIKTTLQAVIKLWKVRPDVFLDLEIYSYYASLVCYFSMAKIRVGFFRKSTFLKDGLYTKLVYFNVLSSITFLYHRMGSVIGATSYSADVSKSFKLKNQKLRNTQHRILINPNASDLSFERRWPKEKFAELINQIITADKSIEVFLVGSKVERELSEEIISLIEKSHANVFNKCGSYDLEQFFEIISTAKLLVTNDSGPMHMAFSFKLPTVCLFGPVHPDQYVSLSNPLITRVIYKKILCSPCIHQTEFPPCRGDNVCMKLITVPEVLHAANELMALPANMINLGNEIRPAQIEQSQLIEILDLRHV